MIQAKFGLPDIAVRTMEVYTTATLEATLARAPEPKPEWRGTMDRLAARAASSYRAIVYDDPHFLDYFRAATPEPELRSIHIGSRPARRGGATRLKPCAPSPGSSPGRRRGCCSRRGWASKMRSMTPRRAATRRS